MSFCIEISNIVKFTIKGAYKGADGAEKPFTFDLTADRLSAEDYADAIAGSNLGDFLTRVITGWSGLKDADGTALEFSADALERLLKLPGMATLVFKTYSAEVVVKEKN